MYFISNLESNVRALFEGKLSSLRSKLTKNSLLLKAKSSFTVILQKTFSITVTTFWHSKNKCTGVSVFCSGDWIISQNVHKGEWFLCVVWWLNGCVVWWLNECGVVAQ
jgi:hypothetical protein